MPIAKTLAAGGAPTTSYHKAVVGVTNFPAGTAEIRVASWADQDAYETGQGAWAEQVVTVGLADLADIDAALLALPLFAGGEIMADGLNDIEAARSRKGAELLRARHAAELGPITVESVEYDADADAQRRIIGAVVAAMVPRLLWLISGLQAVATAAEVTLDAEPTFAIDWTARDASVVTLSEAGVFGLGQALMQNVDAAFGIDRDLTVDLDAAETLEEVLAIAWPDAP